MQKIFLSTTALIAAIAATAHSEKQSFVKTNDKGNFALVNNITNRFAAFVTTMDLKIGDDIFFEREEASLIIIFSNETALAKAKTFVEHRSLSGLIGPKFTQRSTGGESAQMTMSEFMLGVMYGVARATQKDTQHVTVKHPSVPVWMAFLSKLTALSAEAKQSLDAEREKNATKVA